MKWLNNLVLGGVLFLMIHILWFPAAIASKSRSQNAVIQVKNGLLTAFIKEVPLIDLLSKLANQAGIGFELYAEEDRIISAKYHQIPLAEGLRRLLRPSNYIIIYSGKNSQSNRAGIKKIIVYDPSGGRNNRRIQRQTSLSGVRRKDEKADIHKSLEHYAQRLSSTDPYIREEAIGDMADEYEEAALVYLEEALIHDGNDDVRATAAEEIGNLENEWGIEILARGLADPDENVREAVVEALGEIGGKNALTLLRGALKDRDQIIREMAADLIDEIEEDEKGD